MTIPLPEPFHGFYGVPMYSADQLRAYGDARAAEERERCAQVCGKSEAWWDWEDYAASIRAHQT